MRREIAFSLLGFLGGFVVAGFVFWQPAGNADASKPVASAADPTVRESVDSGAAKMDNGRRPLVLAVAGEGAPQSVAEGVSQPKGPSELLHEALADLPGLDANRRQAALNELVKKLRAAGPEGLQAVRDFFRAGQDVKFQGQGYTMVNGKFTQTPSFRMALLNSFGDWPGPEVVELTREILQTTPRMSEAAIAIRQLEAKSPGVYRAEAIQTLQQLAASPSEKDLQFDGGNTIFEAMSYFKASELIPAAEKLVAKNAWSAYQYTQALESLPADTRRAALERLFASPEITWSLASNAWTLQSLNYSEPVVVQNVAKLFASNTDKKFRENFLTNFGANRTMGVNVSGFGTNPGKSAVQSTSAETRVAQMQAKLSFLDQIAPQCTTPVLEERLQDARTELQKAIANPAEPARIGSGAAIQVKGAVGSTLIQADGISVFQVTDQSEK